MRFQPANSNEPRERVIDVLPRLRAHARLMRTEERAADELVEEVLMSAVAKHDWKPANATVFLWLYGIMHMIDRRRLDFPSGRS